MMKAQSREFNEGYVFRSINKTYTEMVRDGLNTHLGVVYVPKIWFGLPYSRHDSNMIPDHLTLSIEESLVSTFKDIAPHYEMDLKIAPHYQYIEFSYILKKKAPPKKMTVAEIEKELGYEIEIVREDHNG